MDKRLNRISLWWGIPGLLVQAGGVVIDGGSNAAGAGPELGGLMILVGAVMLIVGLGYYARAKGHHWVWGLLGLISLLGLIILGLMPDRRRIAPSATTTPG